MITLSLLLTITVIGTIFLFLFGGVTLVVTVFSAIVGFILTAIGFIGPVLIALIPVALIVIFIVLLAILFKSQREEDKEREERPIDVDSKDVE